VNIEQSSVFDSTPHCWRAQAAATWIDRFGHALAGGDPAAVTALLCPDGHRCDLLR